MKMEMEMRNGNEELDKNSLFSALDLCVCTALIG